MTHQLFRARRLALSVAVLVAVAGWPTQERLVRAEQAVAVAAGEDLNEADLREWLTYLASDELQGRRVFTEGYGLAAGYIADHLEEWGLVPLGDNGSYLQTVKRQGYRVTRDSSITVEIGGSSRTFRDGDHVEFPLQAGGPQVLTFTGVDVVGETASPAVNGRLAVVLPRDPTRAPRAGSARARDAALARAPGAGAVMVFSPNLAPAADDNAETAEPPPGGPGRGGRGRLGGAADFTTVDNVERPTVPVIAVDETFLEWLFKASSMPLGDVRAALERNGAPPAIQWTGLAVTVTVNSRYELVSTELTHNVVGMIEGADPALKDTYVFFGAHLDHVGYATTNVNPPGRVGTPLSDDRIWNGADDDASGSAALMALARTFARSPRPKRSVVFVWHTGEEAGLLGSRYMTEFPVVPLERVLAQLNIDMIGRNRDDRESEADTLYVIGADRISTDLHNVVIETNEALARPLRLDFEYNDADDPNSFYTRSDHYSYAVKGIPIAFFFTGTHADYHANTDSPDKILFPKLLRVTRFIHELGRRLADREEPLEHDNLGPRSGRGFRGLLAQ